MCCYGAYGCKGGDYCSYVYDDGDIAPMADVVAIIIVHLGMAVVIWSYVCGSNVYCGCGHVSGAY